MVRSLVDILNALSWYDLAIPRLGTTSVLHEVRLMKSVPEGDFYFHIGRLRILFYRLNRHCY